MTEKRECNINYKVSDAEREKYPHFHNLGGMYESE
jgi:hypothetical protein